MDNKTLIDILSNKLDIPKETVGALIEGLTGVLGECGSHLDTVAIQGFGSFESKKRLERIALHPASGKRLLIPPKIVINFKPSVSLKQKIRKGGKDNGE